MTPTDDPAAPAHQDDPTDSVALALLPLSWRRAIGAELRAGRRPAQVLARVSERGGDAPMDCARLRSRARAALERTARADMRLLAWGEVGYPPLLSVIADPPPVLWIRGDPASLDRLAVAIVGSRAGSPYALAVAERLAGDLAAHGLSVVSGLARGVDSAAHHGALDAGGTTVAVLGSGADVVYPPEHQGLARDIVTTGAVVSELAPGTPPHARFFPLRNRIISGLARAVVVIEAGEKSGSLITARAALDQGRDVLAVPGSVLNGRNRGGHALLRDGAKIVETADDILEELGLATSARRPHPNVSAANGSDDRSGADPILRCLQPGEPCDLDAMAAQSGLPVSTILRRLLDLELRGRVMRVGGGRFVRVDSSC